MLPIGAFWASLVIDSCWSMIFLPALISVAKLFTIAYTRGTNVFTECIDDLSVFLTKILCTRVYNITQLYFMHF